MEQEVGTESQCVPRGKWLSKLNSFGWDIAETSGTDHPIQGLGTHCEVTSHQISQQERNAPTPSTDLQVKCNDAGGDCSLTLDSNHFQGDPRKECAGPRPEPKHVSVPKQYPKLEVHPKAFNPKDESFGDPQVGMNFQHLANCYIDSALDKKNWQIPIWSILTDEVIFVKDVHSTKALMEHQSCEHPPSAESVQEVEDTSLYNADNCNIPWQDKIYLNRDSPNPDTTKETHTYTFYNDRYPEVNPFMASDMFDPEVHICATYLYSEPDAVTKPSKCSWFKTGIFNVDSDARTMGYLKDGTTIETSTKMPTLVDSGCTCPVICQRFYDKSKALQEAPQFPIYPRLMKVANGQRVEANKAVKAEISFGGHYFEFIALIMPQLDGFDFMFGAKAMNELEADLKFSDLTVTFMMRTLPIYPVVDRSLEPGDWTKVQYELRESPSDFHSGKIMMKMLTGHVTKRKIQASIMSKEPMNICASEAIGYLDMRSVGHFYKTQDMYVNLLQNDVDFLTEEETQDMVDSLIDMRLDPVARHNFLKEHYWPKPPLPGAHMQKEIIDWILDHTPNKKVLWHDSYEQAIQALDDQVPDLEDEKQINQPYYPPATHEAIDKVCALTGSTPTTHIATDPQGVNQLQEAENMALPDSTSTPKDDPWPWLLADDPRRNMTDAEIIHQYIDLSESDLTEQEKTLYAFEMMHHMQNLLQYLACLQLAIIHLMIHQDKSLFLDHLQVLVSQSNHHRLGVRYLNTIVQLLASVLELIL